MAQPQQEPQNGARRKGDFKFSFGPFAFEGHGVNVLVGALVVGFVVLTGVMFYHMLDQQALTAAVVNNGQRLQRMDEGNRLLACIITKPQDARPGELRGRDTDCRRFARGEF